MDVVAPPSPSKCQKRSLVATRRVNFESGNEVMVSTPMRSSESLSGSDSSDATPSPDFLRPEKSKAGKNLDTQMGAKSSLARRLAGAGFDVHLSPEQDELKRLNDKGELKRQSEVRQKRELLQTASVCKASEEFDAVDEACRRFFEEEEHEEEEFARQKSAEEELLRKQAQAAEDDCRAKAQKEEAAKLEAQELLTRMQSTTSMLTAKYDKEVREAEETKNQRQTREEEVTRITAAGQDLARQEAEEEDKRLKAQVQEAEEAARIRAAGEEIARQETEEADERRKAQEQEAARKKELETEAARQKAEDEKKQREAQEEEAASIKAADEEAARQKTEDEKKQREAQEEEAARIRAADEEVARQKVEEEDKAREAQEQEAARQKELETEAARQKAEDEKKQSQAQEEEAARTKAVEDDARQKLEQSENSLASMATTKSRPVPSASQTSAIVSAKPAASTSVRSSSALTSGQKVEVRTLEKKLFKEGKKDIRQYTFEMNIHETQKLVVVGRYSDLRSQCLPVFGGFPSNHTLGDYTRNEDNVAKRAEEMRSFFENKLNAADGAAMQTMLKTLAAFSVAH